MGKNTLQCCNIEQTGRIFNIAPKGHFVRQLIFLDACQNCGQPIAEIRQINPNTLETKTILRRSGAKATELLRKNNNKSLKLLEVKNGSKSNMDWLWFDGLLDLWVRDFNNTKIFKIKR